MVGRDDSLLSLLSINSSSVEDFKRASGSAPRIYFRQSFMTAARLFAAIESPNRGVVVPYQDGQELIKDLCSAYEVKRQYKLLREAQRYSVNLFPNEWMKLVDLGAIHESQAGTGIYYLDVDHYHPDFGLSMTPVNKSSILLA
jgi:CRISPR-associated endonuclease/helicase Cas3